MKNTNTYIAENGNTFTLIPSLEYTIKGEKHFTLSDTRTIVCVSETYFKEKFTKA